MNYKENLKIKPKWQIILIMLSRGWWKIKANTVYNLFGYGYWSFDKFKECNKTLKGYVAGNMFITDIWDFQLYFTKKSNKENYYERGKI